MKKEQLSDALNLINDDIIQQTDAARKVNKRYKTMRIARACVAACLLVVIGIGSVILLPKIKPSYQEPPVNPPENTNLPMLTVSETADDGMGFEAYMAHDISELVNANPWTEDCEINTLPVYSNTLNLNERYDITNIDYNKMNSFILEVAKRYGLKENEIVITRDSRAYTDSLFVKAENFEIRVDPELTATIEFEPAVSLPDEYNFTYYNSSYEDIFAAAKYFKSEYSNLINFKKPQINITRGDYNIYDQQSYSIEFFDSSGDLVQDIINYNFNQIAFYCDDDGNMDMIRIFQPDLSEKIGDYPIITADEATQLLANSNFVTTVPYDFLGMEYIKKVELVYRNTYWLDKTYMPYYKFYIELPELENRSGHGLKHYGAYYVPAVKSEYISNMPVWDGNFN